MTDIDQPTRFASLPGHQQKVVIDWLKANYEAAAVPSASSSYELKHTFASSPGGFYTDNGTFKGAVIAAGFTRASPASDRNWTFYLAPRDLRARPLEGSFVAWLFLQRERPDPVGDVARDALADPAFPTLVDDPADVEAYLARQGASVGARQSLARAIAEWRRR